MADRQPVQPAPAEPIPPQRSKGRCFRICAAIWIIISSLFTIGAVYLIYKSAFAVYENMTEPHRGLYIPSSADKGGIGRRDIEMRMKTDKKVWKRNEVVKPLFEVGAKFDLGVTVWVDWTGVERNEGERDDRREKYELFDGKQVEDEPVWEGIVMRDLEIGSKEGQRWTSVELEIPTKPFLDGTSSNRRGLRASFYLVPPTKRPSIPGSYNLTDTPSNPEVKSDQKTLRAQTTPGSSVSSSPWGKLRNISTIPPSHLSGRTRPYYPSKMLSAESDFKYETIPETIEEAMELLAIHVPLVLYLTPNYTTGGLPAQEQPGTRNTTQPFFIKKTSLILARERGVFKKNEWDERHRELRKNISSNVLGKSQNYPPWMEYSFQSILAFEHSPDAQTIRSDNHDEKGSVRDQAKEAEGKEEDELAYFYPPQIATADSILNPFDFEHLPLREELKDGPWAKGGKEEHNRPLWKTFDHQPETIKYNWRVSFSELNHLRASLLNVPNLTMSDLELNYSMTTANALMDFSTSESMATLAGVRLHPHSWTFTRMAVDWTASAINVLLWFIGFYYWYTRTTTIGISIPAALFRLIGRALILGQLIHGGPNRMATFTLLATSAPRFAQALAVFRTRIHWNGGQVSVDTRKATRKEIESEKFDEERTSWTQRFALLVIVFVVVHTAFALRLDSILPLELPSFSFTTPSSKLFDGALLTTIANSFLFTGEVLQIRFNYQRQSFACTTPIAAILNFLAVAAQPLFDGVLGRWKPKRLANTVGNWIIMAVVTAWVPQALLYRQVPQVVDRDTEERTERAEERIEERSGEREEDDDDEYGMVDPAEVEAHED